MEPTTLTKPTATISRLKFSGGDSFQLGPNEKVILVGPNNSGKSQSLREILAISQKGKEERTLVLAELEIVKTGDIEVLRLFLESKADLVDGHYRNKNWQLPEHHIQFWRNDFLAHGLAQGFIKNIAAKERLTICDQQLSVSPGEHKSQPQHVLYDDVALMEKVSGLFRRAFGKDLMFDFRGGKHLPIHVGELPKIDGLVDRVGDTYVRAVRANPRLDQQGDGMKSYAGILFEAIVADLDVTLIDEPEAFLHPPQMRRLGETLASEVSGQLIVATHSSDILRGFLEGTRGNVRILRIRRDAEKNYVAEAVPEVIRELWEKPELRYSNALEGIFHEQTIICEDDSDCRLINSVADHLASRSEEQWQDTAYVPTGGKHGVPKVAGVLRRIGVPVKAVFDIDFLSEQALVQSTVEAFGGQWDEIKQLWTRVDAAVRAGNKPKSIPHIKEEIISLLNTVEDLPKGDVIEAMKQGKAWSEVKKYGAMGIPKGKAQDDYAALRDKLEEMGVYLVPIGEIENFCPKIGSHGPKFVTKLLSTIPLDDDCLSALRIFVERVHKGAHSK
jgi:energy-coupling factor transporter ATP-binding protein EcfA2